MNASRSTLAYESSTTPTPLTRSRLIAEWVRWSSIALAIDGGGAALVWSAAHGSFDTSRLRGIPAIAASATVLAIVAAVGARLLLLSRRAAGWQRASYQFLAFINFQAGLFACAMIGLVCVIYP